jgi:hypothetical protein
MKRYLVMLVAFALAIALAIALAGCGGGSGGGTGGSSASDASGGSSDEAIATIEDLQAALKADHGSEPWFGDITGMTLETFLGAPVLAIHTTYAMTDPDLTAQNERRDAIQAALGDYEITVAPNIAFVDKDGRIVPVGSGGGGVPMYEAFDLPPAPTTAEGVRQWLEQVYGPNGLVKLGPDETWYASIRSIEYKDPGWGTGMHLTVTSDLPTFNSTQGSLLEIALRTTGSPLIANYQIVVKDGSGPVGGGGVSEPGAAGFFYPAQ